MSSVRSTGSGPAGFTGDANTSARTAPGPLKQPMDKLLLVLTITLIGIGIVSVFDASYASQLRLSESEYLLVAKQARWAVIGLAVMLVTMRIPYWTWRKYAFPAIAASIILLVCVFVPHIGHSINYSRRWVGPSALSLQPSEFAKLALILYLAHICTVQGPRLKRLQEGLLPLLSVVTVTCVLIEREPDLGTAMVLFATSTVMLYVAGARGRHLGSLLGLVAFVVLAMSITKPYRMLRLIAFTNPKAYQLDNGYQVWHSLIAIGSGGFAGRGLGDGIEKIFIPMAPTDFIFPVIAEEWGFVGAVIVVTLFLLIVARGYTIAHSTKDTFGSLLATGLTAMIALQSLINIAVATSSIPDTGVPLPFISYGGSSLVMLMASIGLLLNISRYPEGRGRLDSPDGPPRPNERDFEKRWSRPYVPRDPEFGVSDHDRAKSTKRSTKPGGRSKADSRAKAEVLSSRN